MKGIDDEVHPPAGWGLDGPAVSARPVPVDRERDPAGRCGGRCAGGDHRGHRFRVGETSSPVSQSGVSESTQWSILLPVVMLAVLGLLQAGVWLHARTVAGQAAAAVADLRARSGADSAAALQAGRRVAQTGGLSYIEVHIEIDGATLVATVTGEAPMLINLGLGQVSGRAVLPLEGVMVR